MHVSRAKVWKIAIATLWVMLAVFLFVWMDQNQLTFRDLPRVLRTIVRQQGAWGPFFLIVLYALRSFTFLPVSVLTVVAGTLYGPVLGSLLNIVGENITATVSFYLGRFFGRRFVREHETAWLKKYDELLTRDGFFPVLLMRFLLFPFDVVSIGSGMTGIPYVTYAIATFIGLLPAIVTFTVLGNAFTNPRSLAVSLLFLVLLLGLSAFLVRHPRVRHHLGHKAESHE